MKKITITIKTEFALIEYDTLRNKKLRYGIEIIDGTLKYCPESFGIDYDSQKDEFSFVDNEPKNIMDFEKRQEILIAILKKENLNWQNIKWKVDPENYMESIL